MTHHSNPTCVFCGVKHHPGNREECIDQLIKGRDAATQARKQAERERDEIGNAHNQTLRELDEIKARLDNAEDCLGVVAKERDSLTTANARQVKLLKEATSTLAEHMGHWDKTGKRGAGCPVCIKQRELSQRIEKALAAQQEGGEG